MILAFKLRLLASDPKQMLKELSAEKWLAADLQLCFAFLCFAKCFSAFICFAV